MSNISKRVTIDFPNDIYRMVKTFTAFTDSSVREFVLKAVNKELVRNNIHIPNDETLETFAKTDQGEGLEEFNDFNSFLESVNRDINKS